MRIPLQQLELSQPSFYAIWTRNPNPIATLSPQFPSPKCLDPTNTSSRVSLWRTSLALLLQDVEPSGIEGVCPLFKRSIVGTYHKIRDKDDRGVEEYVDP